MNLKNKIFSLPTNGGSLYSLIDSCDHRNYDYPLYDYPEDPGVDDAASYSYPITTPSSNADCGLQRIPNCGH